MTRIDCFVVRCFFVATLMLIVMSPSSARSWSAHGVDNHSVISEYAVNLFNRCVALGVGQSARASFAANGTMQALIGATHAEELQKLGLDTAWEDTALFQLLLRPFNWHFHHSDTHLQKTETDKGFFERSRFMFRRFRLITEKLDEQLNSSDETETDKAIYQSIASAMHYLEDVAAPAHVAPAYHVKWKPDSLDPYKLVEWQIKPRVAPVYGDQRDAIEDPLNGTETAAVRALCDSLSADIPKGNAHHALRALLDKAADNTREAMTQTIGDHENLTWDVFWLSPETVAKTPGVEPSKKDFGAYGRVGDRCSKGKPGMAFGCDQITVGTRNVSIDRATYDAFVSHRFGDAVATDVMALFYIAKRLNGHN